MLYIEDGESSLLKVTIPESGVGEGLNLGVPGSLPGLVARLSESTQHAPCPRTARPSGQPRHLPAAGPASALLTCPSMIVSGHSDAQVGGRWVSRLVATRNPGLWPVMFLEVGVSLGEAVGVAGGGDQVGVVHEAVGAGSGEGLGHDRVEA